MVSTEIIYHGTVETCLKRIKKSGFELLKKELCRFAFDINYVTHSSQKKSPITKFNRSPLTVVCSWWSPVNNQVK